ncbi:hypothetical protein BG842_02535 [Haladaptatus sp. W1]|nr:hypothetical protein BG842_02535 [Haladaptatus sp. W1]
MFKDFRNGNDRIKFRWCSLNVDFSFITIVLNRVNFGCFRKMHLAKREFNPIILFIRNISARSVAFKICNIVNDFIY